MGLLRRLFGRGSTPGGDAINPDLQMLFDEYGLAALDRQIAFGEIDRGSAWQLDQEQAMLRLGDDLILPMQILGSTARRGRTWRWAWANESVDPALAERARAAAEIGRARGIALLTEAESSMDRIVDGHVFALAVTGLLDGDAYYRCPHDAGEVYVIVDLPQVRESAGDPVTRTLDVVGRALSALPIPVSRAAIGSYVRSRNLPIVETANEVRIGDGERGTFRFDEMGRIVEIRGILGSAEPNPL